MGNYQTDLQNDHTILYSHLQRMSFQIDSHPHQHWELVIFWIPAISMAVTTRDFNPQFPNG